MGNYNLPPDLFSNKVPEIKLNFESKDSKSQKQRVDEFDALANREGKKEGEPDDHFGALARRPASIPANPKDPASQTVQSSLAIYDQDLGADSNVVGVGDLNLSQLNFNPRASPEGEGEGDEFSFLASRHQMAVTQPAITQPAVTQPAIIPAVDPHLVTQSTAKSIVSGQGGEGLNLDPIALDFPDPKKAPAISSTSNPLNQSKTQSAVRRVSADSVNAAISMKEFDELLDLTNVNNNKNANVQSISGPTINVPPTSEADFDELFQLANEL